MDSILTLFIVSLMMRSAVSEVGKQVCGSTSNLPLSMARRLNELGDVNAFMEEFVENKKDFRNNKSLTISSRSALPTTENGHLHHFRYTTQAPPLLANEICSPVPTLVRLHPDPKHERSNVIYYPDCGYVKRCLGCCNTWLLACEPTQTRTITIPAVESTLILEPHQIINKTVRIPVVEHLKCACGCKIKANDCQISQVYSKEACRCYCNNYVSSISEDSCKARGKQWDIDTCSCVCPPAINTDCSTHTHFDYDLCRCVLDDPSDENTLLRRP